MLAESAQEAMAITKSGLQTGQGLVSRFFESESRRILRSVKANKQAGSLAMVLDSTLKSGHDMKRFALGTLASMASKERYAQFTWSMLKVYMALEGELDASTGVTRTLWAAHSDVLRRNERLAGDFAAVSAVEPAQSAATAAYIERVLLAGTLDRSDGGGRLLGHAYCRYLADLFGGQALATPVQLAVGVRPSRYDFNLPSSRHDYIEALYQSFNDAGHQLDTAAVEAVRLEAIRAFGLNAELYAEPHGLALAALRGGANTATGALFGRW